MSPMVSVRRVRIPALESAPNIDGDGCPNSLSLPTDTTASLGDISVRLSRPTAASLPWCGTFSTSQSGKRPSPPSVCHTGSSASPVRSTETPDPRTRSTRLLEFSSVSPTEALGAVSGHSTVTSRSPTASEFPAERERTSARGNSALTSVSPYVPPRNTVDTLTAPRRPLAPPV